MSRSSKKVCTSQHPMTRPRQKPSTTSCNTRRHIKKPSSPHRRFRWLLTLIPFALLDRIQPGTFVNAQVPQGPPQGPADGGIPGPSQDYVPLRVTNNCPETVWPGIGTQAGQGPGTGGFELPVGMTMAFIVGPTWQGRVWGRTNCTFNEDGTAPGNQNVSAPGWDGGGKACMTGDCFGVMDCAFTGAIPTTLAEFNLRGGVSNSQTFYDISLVDGYNLPMGIVYIPAANTSDIPPNLTNPSCVATAGFLYPPSRTGETYTNSTYPTPWESRLTNADVADWCPWDLQVWPPAKPGNGVYPYPDDNIQRPVFDPCLSACSSTGRPQDCCTGKYNDPNTCKPGLYSKNAKSVCPDAYSFAFDDATSTFIVPAGGGWEVVFCPAGRSTDILATFGDILSQVASGHGGDAAVLARTRNVSFIQSKDRASPLHAGSVMVRAEMWLVLGIVLVQLVVMLSL